MKLLFIMAMLISSLFGWVAEITALKGSADIIRKNQTLPAAPGDKLEKADTIKTHDNTKMQIIFKDNTVITIGKNSQVNIADYLFDAENSKAKFNLSHGIMKTLTGKIGKFAPKRFKVLTKNASIGIRGTYFVVESNDDYIKVGMISGVTTFTNLENMRTFEVKAGEQLVFNEKTNNIEIKKGFKAPDAVTIKPKKEESTDIYQTANATEEKTTESTKDVTNPNKNNSNKVFTGFLKGLKDLF